MRQAYVEDGKLVVRDEDVRGVGNGGDGLYEIVLSLDPERPSDQARVVRDAWSDVVLLQLMGDVRTLLLWRPPCG